MSANKVRFLLQLAVLVLIAAVFTRLYMRGAIRQMHEVNVDPDVTDQGAYIAYARELYESGYTYIGDHNRMPVYPALQSLFLQPDMKRREIFEQGKRLNLYLSLPLLGGIAVLLGRRFSKLHTLNLVLVTGFLVFIFKAGWFQSELLFYFLNFCLFLEMLSLLKNPSYGLAILTGVTAGLAHLTKASILPGLAIFAAVYAFDLVLRWMKNRQISLSPYAEQGRRLLVLPLVLVVFLASVYPYISTSKRVFGHYFYNVNSTFYIWYDSWEEAKQGTRAYGDRVGWPDMPPEQIPSLGKYLREHSLSQIAARFARGARLVGEEIADSYGYLPYLLTYAGLLVMAAVVWRRRVLELIRSEPLLFLFVVLYFCAYLLLYFWYAPIAAGNRLVLAQFLPLMFSMACGLSALLEGKSLRLAGREVGLLLVVNLVILPFILFDVYNVLTDRIGWMIGGD
jgi:hypothetical protein